jgi:arylsulfatase A-like enzyme
MVQNNAVYTESRYVTDVITDHALDFLNAQQANDAPFYLSVHYTAPHSPWDRANHPAAIYDRYFNECAFRSLPQDPIHPCQVVGLITADGANRRVILSGYFAAVTAMDANVGRLLDRLDETGLRSNTLILFTSDNGMNMGHHGIYGKGNGTFPQNMYDTSVKVPMLMSRPGFVAQNQVRRELLSHYDVMPTLLAYTGSRMPQNALLPGRSFAELLRGKPLAEREAVVVGDEYGPVRMIRTREWKYIHRYLYGPHELYDLANDPDEQRNLIGEAQYRNRAAELYSSLGKWFDAYTDPSLDGRRERVTGVGQDGPTGIQADGRTGFSGEEPGMLRDL